jgi:cytochrome o ubiquinol oxidase subunit 2
MNFHPASRLSRRHLSPRPVAVLALALPLVLSLTACTNEGVLAPRGPVAAANRMIMFNSLVIMLAIVVPTIIAALAFAWWFRAGNGRAHYDPDFVYSGRVEAIVWGIPLLTIVFLSGLIWIGSHELDPYRRLEPDGQQPLEVQVVSLDWKWLFIYPDQGVATLNQLVVPVGRPVHFTLTSASVMNTFFVPQLGSQIYTMNGMATQLSLQADEPGTYRGQSSHFSGDGFAKMVFPVRAVAPEEFTRWATQARGAGQKLDRAAYANLARQSEGDPPVTFGAVEPGLFDAIVRRQIPPAEGPREARGGDSEVRPEGAKNPQDNGNREGAR